MTLEKINKKIRKCKKCRLYKTAKKAVPGEGNSKAKIMFIGIAPGVEEDKTGKPFVGRAGRFLDELLGMIKLDRKKVFITSVLKHFPPKNRIPKMDEVWACLPYLEEQIKTIKPKIIVTLGNLPFRVFFGIDKEIDKVHGKRFRKNGIIFFPMHHPSAGMRFPKIGKIMKKDILKIRRLIK
jgi:DNA polymerase